MFYIKHFRFPKMFVVGIFIFLLMVTVVRLTAAQAGNLASFSLQWSSPVTNQTSSVVWGDYDGDGDLDVAFGNGHPLYGPKSNQLYQNDNGILKLVWSSSEIEVTSSVAWGDYDGDGDLDLVVGNNGQSNRLYQNNGGAFTLVWSSSEMDVTNSVAWGDYDGDDDLDLVVGNNGQPNRLYRNDNGGFNLAWSSSEIDATSSAAWGDYDSDGDLDLVVGNGNPDLTLSQPNRLYRNDNGGFNLAWSSSEIDATSSVAWGDYDSDGDLDLVVGNGTLQGQPDRIYRNDVGVLVLAWSSSEIEDTRGVAWGDYNGDNLLDLITAGDGEPNRLYRNDGEVLTISSVWSSSETGVSNSVAWGDYDGDGDLDLVVGRGSGQPNQLYRNDSGILTNTPVWSATENSDLTLDVTWGDYDGDGDLDLAAGNWGGPNRLYRNDGGILTQDASWSSAEFDATTSLAWGDYDNDGDLDLAVGNATKKSNRLYRNESGDFPLVWSSEETDDSHDVAWGDYDNDGDLDLAVGNAGQANHLYRNDGGVLTTNTVWVSNDENNTWSIAWGDHDGDGDLDLAAGNGSQPNRIYLNDNGQLTKDGWPSTESSITLSLAWGDYNGDGNLDLAAGNWTQPNQLYRNEGGTLTSSSVWTSILNDETYSVAWGDYDGDGDLDLAVGNHAEFDHIYQNLRRTDRLLINDPPYVTISRPGITDDTDFYSSAEIIQTANISISYTLFDHEGDIVSKIFPEYSPTGGGQWFPATPGPGGDGLTNLTASSGGTPSTFVWNATADLIKSDNVVFRIRAQPNYTHSPILWPAVDGKSPPFRVAAPWYIKVVDSSGQPISGTLVYGDGQPLGSTNQAGLLNPGPLNIGTELVAVAQVEEQATIRAGHDGWAYRTHLTNLNWDDSGSDAYEVTGTGEQLLVASQPLIAFNLLVSVEWDATDDYLDDIAQAMQSASDYLFDLTDGQMAFGQVNIYDNGSNWADADLQISTQNIVRPHAIIGGITSPDKSHVIRVGRFWDGDSGNQGPWDQPTGYRTLAHEFGHYGLYLYDEYFAYTFDAGGNVTGEAPAFCTVPKEQLPADDSASASAMYRQYDTSELSAQGVDGLWSVLCEQTAQWQFNGESAWETIAQKYADTQVPARWQLTTPADRGSVLAGPAGVPAILPEWPQVEIHQAGPSSPPLLLTVYGPQGPYWGAIVALYKQDGRVIGQGFTDSNGQLEIYGAIEGDTLRASSFDGGLAGNVAVGTTSSLNLTLEAVGALSTQAAGGIPHMRVVAQPSLTPNQIDLLVSLQNFGPGADPFLIVTEPGSEASFAPNLSYSPDTDTYEGQISFSAIEQGMGRIRAVGEVGGSLLRLQSTYRLQQVVNNQGQDIFSNDGNLSLHLESGSLPGNDAYLVVMPPGAVPGPLPGGLVLVGDPYAVTTSGALVQLVEPGVLKLGYDGTLVKGASAPEGLDIYRWDPNTGVWQAMGGTLDGEQKAVVFSTTALGTYALLAPPGAWIDPTGDNSYLPIILK